MGFNYESGEDTDQDISFDDDKQPEDWHCLCGTETSDYLVTDLINQISTLSQK